MTDALPQLYLISPPQIDAAFASVLSRILDAEAVACVRLQLATRDEDTLIRACDALRVVTEPRDVALVVSDHWKLAERAGLDGVHLSDGARQVKKARADLGSDAIVGAFCGASRHDGITAGEMGADYVAFGPVGGPDLGDTQAQDDLFQWWSEMIEVPVVAEGGLDEAAAVRLAASTDFIALGEELWIAPDPLERLRAILREIPSQSGD
ncbi:thiamine phosphate synthase [Palleronia abyssalis]|uniref:Thiamine-phosphate synthase n=1 Tax=Palleronia abyssalis TaxID=1501240 RepID=A0A2R8BQ67_9RHOB|nr:thiamine phosphate synthase [Palleronia abyssalis]SPJ22236.1 Thiamine-phosphate synthase [Palleronia abyssalis]